MDWSVRLFRRILFVYPEFDPTFWGFKHTLAFSHHKPGNPPLGLITVAALTPREYECQLVDLNCESLTEKHIEWADTVCFSAMLTQKKALFEAAARCRVNGKLIVFGGPFPTSYRDECFAHCDLLVLNEAGHLAFVSRGSEAWRHSTCLHVR